MTAGLERTKELFSEQRFLEEHRSGIGGSKAGSVYDLGFGCKRQTYYELTGTRPDFSKVSTAELERGKFVESVACMVYEARTGRKVVTRPMKRHPQYEYMLVHVDGETTAPEHEGPGYVEFKCINRFVMKKFKKEGIREEYILQLQHGMAVCGYSWGSFGILCLDPWQFEWFDVDRDDSLIEKLIEDERLLWQRIKVKEPPKPLEDIKDKRCASCQWRRTCRGSDLAALIPDSQSAATGEELISKPELTPLLQEIDELGEIKDDAAELYEDARARLKAEIGEAYGIVAPGYRALMPTSYPERLDNAAIKALIKDAEKILSLDRECWDYEQLENRCTELMQIIIQLTKVKKPAKAERSLRIYATGD